MEGVMWIILGCVIGFYVLVIGYLAIVSCTREDPTTPEEDEEQARIIGEMSHGN
jgi:hypothetical protein